MILLPITVTTELYIVWICLVGDSGIHLHLPLLLGGFASQGTMSVWEQKKWKNKKKSIWYPKKHADLSSKKQLTKERTNRTQVVVYQKVMNHAGSSILRKSVKTKFTHAQHVTPKNHPPTPPPSHLCLWNLKLQWYAMQVDLEEDMESSFLPKPTRVNLSLLSSNSGRWWILEFFEKTWFQNLLLI